MNNKTCTECIRFLPLNMFYKMRNGHESKCIDCKKEYMRKRRRNNYDSRSKKWSLKYYYENKSKMAAAKVARWWLERGLIEREPCAKENADCEGKLEMHHEDYEKSIDIIWFCKFHHGERHREINKSKQLVLE